MASNKGAKVIIAGGGIAGLTLALMLETLDTDYLLLEAHEDIAPEVGASIGLTPNSLRIFDQLGVYDAIEALPHAHIEELCVRGQDGRTYRRLRLPFAHSGKRHGYTTRFFARQWLLQILYDSLRHKERVLTGKKVIGISPATAGDGFVEVTTRDGSLYRGAIVIGADGVHSTVREQIHAMTGKALGEKEDKKKKGGGEGHEKKALAGREADDDDGMACSYRCSFGIAQHVPGWDYSRLVAVPGDGVTMVATSGADGRVYWFVFEKLPETLYGRWIPRAYSAQDEADFAAKYAEHRLTDDVTFGQLFSKRLSSTLTPLHEGVHGTWFSGRTLVLGDSAHKSNPIGSQGGSSIVEATALLVNGLRQKMDARQTDLAGLTDADVTSVFATFQDAHKPRASQVVSRAHAVQALAAFEQPALSRIGLGFLLPWIHDEHVWARTAPVFADAPRIAHLSVPARPRAIPFDDELPVAPVRSRMALLSALVVTVGSSLGLLWLVVNMQFPYLAPPFTWGPDDEPLDRTWLPTKFLNDNALFVVSVCSLPVLDDRPGPTAHLVYLLAQMLSPNLIYTVEAYRVGNAGTPLASPFLNFAVMGIVALAGAQQYWTVASALFGHALPTGRAVPLDVAHSLTPALALGFALPAVLMFLPVPDARVRQDWNALWQFGTFFFIALTDLFARVLRRWWSWRPLAAAVPGTDRGKDDADLVRYRNKDAAVLQGAYLCVGLVQAVSHLAALLYAHRHPALSVRDFFFGFPSPWTDWSSLGRSAWVSNVLQYDLVLYVAGAVVHNLHAVWKLRASGYVAGRECVAAAVCVVLGQFCLGSGATWAALWYWREGVLASLSTIE
ncbi:Putative FAD-binding domain, FAD/NAD(P)-binding domain superfamily [Colletotrichum destructivum]|uniref:FAD-binding domain, FAD/NAD(P)-binding domain superfamily n=1 Tax=Colletotrichum destructivum TaxID=34406 RepID=A0AAX4IKK5_9PEZI|nr:Putative FAD-binding domain, FAD/NAD(P)-binding domain superfamily [Colletotrichum destructivum]